MRCDSSKSLRNCFFPDICNVVVCVLGSFDERILCNPTISRNKSRLIRTKIFRNQLLRMWLLRNEFLMKDFDKQHTEHVERCLQFSDWVFPLFEEENRWTKEMVKKYLYQIISFPLQHILHNDNTDIVFVLCGWWDIFYLWYICIFDILHWPIEERTSYMLR